MSVDLPDDILRELTKPLEKRKHLGKLSLFVIPTQFLFSESCFE